MSPALQTLTALLCVAAAAGWLGYRAYARRAKPGCGGDCGCPASELREQVRSHGKSVGKQA
jgi:attachment p12 family protein